MTYNLGWREYFFYTYKNMSVKLINIRHENIYFVELKEKKHVLMTLYSSVSDYSHFGFVSSQIFFLL